MSVSSIARLGRIDNHFLALSKKFNSLNAQMQATIREARVATAFMHDNPNAEFTQEDKDKYSSLFVAAVMAEGGFASAGALLQPLIDLETQQKTIAEFIAEETGYVAADYSAQFDQG